ncbi:MAG: hypothetical protein GY806_10530 [Gammaproteobacteria bacterium]|nr:hypothetical protein [Gammaproteobacteria bacterium]
MNFQIWKALHIQVAVSVLYVSASALWKESVMFSAIIGCLAGLIPNGYFYFRMSKQVEGNNAQQWLGYAYRSEFGKWLMTGMIFMLVFTSKHTWDPIVLFAGYVLIQISSWFVPFVIKGN